MDDFAPQHEQIFEGYSYFPLERESLHRDITRIQNHLGQIELQAVYVTASGLVDLASQGSMVASVPAGPVAVFTRFLTEKIPKTAWAQLTSENQKRAISAFTAVLPERVQRAIRISQNGYGVSGITEISEQIRHTINSSGFRQKEKAALLAGIAEVPTDALDAFRKNTKNHTVRSAVIGQMKSIVPNAFMPMMNGFLEKLEDNAPETQVVQGLCDLYTADRYGVVVYKMLQ